MQNEKETTATSEEAKTGKVLFRRHNGIHLINKWE